MSMITNIKKQRGDAHTNERTNQSGWGTYIRTNKQTWRGDVHTNEQTNLKGGHTYEQTNEQTNKRTQNLIFCRRTEGRKDRRTDYSSMYIDTND